MCVYMAFMCISAPFIHAVLVLRTDNTFITFQDPRNIFLRRHSLRVSSYQNYLPSVLHVFLLSSAAIYTAPSSSTKKSHFFPVLFLVFWMEKRLRTNSLIDTTMRFRSSLLWDVATCTSSYNDRDLNYTAEEDWYLACWVLLIRGKREWRHDEFHKFFIPLHNIRINKVKVKGNVHPRTDHEGPKRE